jgi:hypothetical protein
MSIRLDLQATAITLTVTSLLALGCSSNDSGAEETVASDESAYVLWQRGAACMIRRSLEPSIKLCVTGVGDLNRARTLSQQSLEQWLNAIRPLHPNVTSVVEFTCTSPHGRLIVDNTGEYAYAGEIHIRETSAPGTYLHEFGHAFACLGDTYLNGTAAYCAAGQPHSIMCDGLLRNDLTADDIAGAQVQFRAMVDAGTPPVTPPSTPPVTPPADADGDGVADSDDLCEKTPPGSHVWRDQFGGQWKGCAPGEFRTRPVPTQTNDGGT